MGRRCPETGEYVLYTACLECEKRSSCGRTPPEKPVFALLVVGTRTFEDYDFVSRKLDATIANIRDKYRFLIVSGGARGVDTLADVERNHILDALPPAGVGYVAGDDEVGGELAVVGGDLLGPVPHR